MTGGASRAVEPNSGKRPVVVIGGPTASGKSDAAVAVANAIGMRIRDLPLTLERVLLGRALSRKDSRGSAKAQSEK